MLYSEMVFYHLFSIHNTKNLRAVLNEMFCIFLIFLYMLLKIVGLTLTYTIKSDEFATN